MEYIISEDQLDDLRRIAMDYNEGYDNVRTHYSGRFMFGAQCIAIDLDLQSDFNQILSRIDDDELRMQLETRATWDQMGLGLIVYFPRMKVANED